MTRGARLLEKLGDRLSGLRGRVTPDAEMEKITWFRAGGPADALFQPADEEDLAAFLRAVPQDVPVMVVGIGSNLLVREGGIPGFVVRLSAKGFGEAEALSEARIRAGAATPDKRLAAGQMQTKNVQAVSGVVGAMTKAAVAIVLAAVFDLMADIDYLADARLQLRTPDDRTRTAISLQLAARYEPPYGL